ncbi:MAG: hypothetical protein IDH49_14585 [Gammaproteobacteria bacterium]|nr:hypothetical protein [Gammaproteobacteria bacterium]
MKNKAYFILVVTLFFIPISSKADYVMPPEPYPFSVTYNDIRRAILDGHFRYALKLAKDLATIELKKALNDEKKLLVLVNTLSAQLKKILDDPNRSDEEKSKAVIGLIEQSMGPHQSAPAGSLNLKLKHSIEYGVTQLSWDQKLRKDKCREAVLVTNNGITSIEYTEYYILSVPAYSIYRITNGQSKLLTKIEGMSTYTTNTFSFNPTNLDAWKAVRDIYNFYKNIPSGGVGDDRVLFDDLNSDYRTIGTTASYKVVANNPKVGDYCGNPEYYESTAMLDSNGDGKADFIPQAEYSRIAGKYYGWLVPVLSIIQ